MRSAEFCLHCLFFYVYLIQIQTLSLLQIFAALSLISLPVCSSLHIFSVLCSSVFTKVIKTKQNYFSIAALYLMFPLPFKNDNFYLQKGHFEA